MKLSTGLIRAVLGGSMDLASALSGCVIDVYQGTLPASPNDPATGTLLLTYSLNGSGAGISYTMGAAPSTTLSKTSGESWSGVAVAAGTMQYFRVRKTTDTANALSLTAIRMDGLVGAVNGDLNPGNQSTVAVGDPRQLYQHDLSLQGA